MIFDGDCYFCSLWIRRWQHATGDRVDYLPFQDSRIAGQFPELPRGQFESAVQLVETDGSVYGGAEAVFRALAHNRHEQWLVDWYDHSPAFVHASEWGYRKIAGNRRFLSACTRLGWGRHLEPPAHLLVRSVFLRSLGVIYLIAFVSLWAQIIGLVGSNGILPAKSTMGIAQRQVEAQKLGVDRYHLAPTLCWLDSSDGFLKAQCAAGAGLALLVIVGIAPAPCLFLLWLIYLSLSTVSREFLSFQWDLLLLQTGFLAIFLAPLQVWAGVSRAAPPSRLVLWLLRWLLFQLMFESGCVKLVSGDSAWHHLTALNSYYQTQPLPTWIGWYAHQLPAWAQKASAAAMFGIELFAPFLIFAPRRPRQFACWAFVLLQVLIFLTGNYCFLNLLTIALCVLLLDDAALMRFLPGRLHGLASPNPQRSTPKLWRWPSQVTIPLACISLAISLMRLGGLSRLPIPWPTPLLGMYVWLSPLRTFNSYGLFAAMPTSRREIIIEGSNDGVTWLEYEFKCKPGDVKQRPKFVVLQQPRLDWQMWVAGLGSYQNNPWLVSFCARLLDGSPGVLGLLERDPFPNKPPRHVRAVVYEYHFTDSATRRKTGAWWRREKMGDYMPPLSMHQSGP